MPITITIPPPLQVVTPGGNINWSSDFTGVLQMPAEFQVSIFQPGLPGETGWFGPQTTDTTDGSLRLGDIGPGAVPAQTQNFVEGDPTTVHVDLVDQTGVVDTGQQIFPWDPVASLGALNFYNSTHVMGGASGGLTAQQAAQLQDVWNFVQQVFQTSQGLTEATPVGSLISHPPTNLLSLCPGGSLSGRGKLDIPQTPLGIFSYGLALDAVQVPAGIGVRNGVVLEYLIRIAQFVPLYPQRNPSSLLNPEVFDLIYQGFAWYWRDPFPFQVLYDITPGCVVNYQWICLF